MTRIEPSADVSPSATIGEDSSIWHLAQVREDAVLGEHCNIGRGAYIGPGVVLGKNCKVQNYALVYEPARLADGVFIGPAAVLTNDLYPRATTPDRTRKGKDDWQAVAVTIGEGASIGARAVCIAPVTIGACTTAPPARWSPGTCRSTHWWPGCPPSRSAGSASAATAWSIGTVPGTARKPASAMSIWATTSRSLPEPRTDLPRPRASQRNAPGLMFQGIQ